jgi:drug/metabolite transporter (DMT)-like permease
MTARQNTYYWSVMLALMTVFLWSLSAPGAKFVNQEANYLALPLVRFGCGAVVFGAWLWYDRDSCRTHFADLASGDDGSIYRFGAIVFLFGVFLLIYDVTFLFSIQNGPSIPANVINYLWPLLFPALGGLVFRRSDSKFGWFELGVLSVAFCGAALIAGGTPSTAFADARITYLLAFVAALSAGVYMNLLSMAQDFIDSTPLIFFIAVLVALVVESIAILATGAPVRFDRSSLPLVFLYGFGTFGLGHFTWSQAINLGEDVLISSLAYLTPILSTIFLHVFVDAPFTETVAFGAVLIIVAQVLLNDTFRHLTSLGGALITIFLSTLFLYVDPSRLGNEFLSASITNLIGTIFAILTGFMLNRVWRTNRKENEKLNQINATIRRLIERVEEGDLTKDEIERAYGAVDGLMIAIIDLNYARGSEAIGPLTREVNEELSKTRETVTTLTATADVDPETELRDVESDVREWLMLSQERVKRGEMVILALLGVVTVVTLLLNAGDSFFGHLVVIGLSGGIVFTLLKIRDYNHNRAGQPTRLLFEQQIVTEIQRSLYFPREEFTYAPEVAEFIGSDETVRVGDADGTVGEELRTVSEVGVRHTVRYGVLSFVLAAIGIVVALLYLQTV